MTKFCVNCKFYREPSHVIVPYKYCVNPALGRDLVTGNPEKLLASDCRNLNTLCGKNGDWFESVDSTAPKQNKKKWWMLWTKES